MLQIYKAYYFVQLYCLFLYFLLFNNVIHRDWKEPKFLWKSKKIGIFFLDFQSAFNIFDGDGGGEISTRELLKVFKMLGFTPTKDELDEIIEVVDQDGSGEIDFDEFLIMMVMQLKEESKSQDETVLKEAFRILDTYVEKLLINIVNICGVIAILVILRDLKSENN